MFQFTFFTLHKSCFFWVVHKRTIINEKQEYLLLAKLLYILKKNLTNQLSLYKSLLV